MRLHHFIKDVLKDAAYLSCLRHLKNQADLSGRELAKLSGVSQFKIRTVLDDLSRQGLLKKRLSGRSHLYAFNKHHFLAEKIALLLEIEENFFSFLGTWIMNRMDRKPISIILFGSMARGEERPDSDMDLLFIYRRIDSEANLVEKINEALSDSLEYFGNRLAPVLTTPASFQKAIKNRDPFFLHILKEGITLKGAAMNEVLL